MYFKHYELLSTQKDIFLSYLLRQSDSDCLCRSVSKSLVHVKIFVLLSSSSNTLHHPIPIFLRLLFLFISACIVVSFSHEFVYLFSEPSLFFIYRMVSRIILNSLKTKFVGKFTTSSQLASV